MCGPEDPLFTPLPPFARVPFQAKESVHKTPFWENLEILASTASYFTQILAHKPPILEIFSSQVPKIGNFPLTSPQILKFSAHKPPNFEIFRSQAPIFRGKLPFASPTLRKSGPHTPTWKKVECPPRGSHVCWRLVRLLPIQCIWGGKIKTKTKQKNLWLCFALLFVQKYKTN